MGVNHGRGNIIVAKKFLDCLDIIVCLQKMCGKRVAERVDVNRCADPYDDSD
jgi:hypothetical protein